MNIFGDYELQDGTIIARETGAKIPLTVQLLNDVVKVTSFVLFVNALKATRFIRGHEPRAKISFFPKQPKSFYAIWPVCQMADVKIVENPEEADLHFYFEDCDFPDAPCEVPSPKPVFNAQCNDIRKSVIAQVFEDVFGYSLSIDPAFYNGPAVEKSKMDGAPKQSIVECPLERPHTDRVYQRLVDNTFDGTDFIDIRTPIVGGKIPFVYLKRRPSTGRFSKDDRQVDIIDADAVLSSDEQEKILKFSKAMALDFGGLDVLRNREDGRIYIVDVNKTDMGPPAALSGKQKLYAIRGLADAFSIMVNEALTREI